MKKVIIIIGIICVIVIGKITFSNWYYDKERIVNKQIATWNERIQLLSEYKEYVPQVLDGDNVVEAQKMLTKEHQENVITVLNYYGKKWKMENGNLLVSKTIENEILWNYTKKANDSIWLHEHK